MKFVISGNFGNWFDGSRNDFTAAVRGRSFSRHTAIKVSGIEAKVTKVILEKGSNLSRSD